MRVMYDTVDATRYPANAEMAAGYVNGTWPTFNEIPAQVPVKVSISISPYTMANVYDVERYDLTPEQVPTALGTNPNATIYASRDTWNLVKAVLSTTRLPLPPWWAAVPGYQAGSLYPGSVATQHSTIGGCDVSTVADYWPGIDKLPTGDDEMCIRRDQTTGRCYLQTADGRLYWIPDTVPDLTALEAVHGKAVNLSTSFLSQFPGYQR